MSGRDGAVLYVALLVLIPLSVMTFGLVSAMVSFQRERLHLVQDEQALAIAEAGLDEAITALRLGGTGDVATAAAPASFGRGMLWVETEVVGNDLLRVQANGMYLSGRASVEALVFRDDESLLDTAIFSSMPLDSDANVFIDSFDSAGGSYASQVTGGVAGSGAIVESNAGVDLDATTSIYGDVHPGPEYEVSTASNVMIAGVTQPLTSTRTLQAPPVPTLTSAGSVTYKGKTTLPAGSYAYDDLVVNSNLTIEGPATVVVNSLELLSNSSLTFDTSTGEVELFVLDSLVVASNSAIITTEPSATLFTLYFLGAYADLRSNSAFYGLILAPNGTVELHSNFEVYGTVLANEVVLNSNVRLHYDQALLGKSSAAPIYTRATWTRVGFPVLSLLADRRDPSLALGLDPALLNLPADAHDQP